jgi:hypothetical protein
MFQLDLFSFDFEEKKQEEKFSPAHEHKKKDIPPKYKDQEKIPYKLCIKCHQEFPDTFQYFRKRGSERYTRTECKKCNEHLERVRATLRKEHGPAPEDHVCPICLKTEEEVKYYGGKTGSFCVDHDHDTDEFRGWLCNKCNRSLGGFEDDIESLKRAIEYLSKDNV